MRFLLDANVRFSVGTFLQSIGHEVRFLAGTPEHDLADRDVLALACNEDRILITNDKDFGQLIFQQQLQHRGVILFSFAEYHGRKPMDEGARRTLRSLVRRRVGFGEFRIDATGVCPWSFISSQ